MFRGSAGLYNLHTCQRLEKTDGISVREEIQHISLGSAVTIYTWLSNGALGILTGLHVVYLVEWVVTVWKVQLGQSA
jgi:hypothetical protein